MQSMEIVVKGEKEVLVGLMLYFNQQVLRWNKSTKSTCYRQRNTSDYCDTMAHLVFT